MGVIELAESLETRAAIRRKIPRPEPDRISRDCELAAKYLRQMYAELIALRGATKGEV